MTSRRSDRLRHWTADEHFAFGSALCSSTVRKVMRRGVAAGRIEDEAGIERKARGAAATFPESRRATTEMIRVFRWIMKAAGGDGNPLEHIHSAGSTPVLPSQIRKETSA
jgi:hypothetical protein